MNSIAKGVIFGGKARVSVINITDIVNEEIELHQLSPLATAVLGRAMVLGSYVSTNLKDADSSFSVTINGGGPIGNVVVAGEGNNYIRGYVYDPTVDLPVKENGHLDVGQAVGKNGFITVIKDLGLKEPYVGRCQLVSGEIAEDFAKYLATSEGIQSAVAFGVKVDKNGCMGAGGVIVEALPGCDDNQLFVLEDIMSNFANVSDYIATKTPSEILEFYFGHLDCETFPVEEVRLRCNCSDKKIKDVVLGLGQKEAESIVKEVGKIEIACQFCGKKYIYTAEEVDRLWQK